MDSKYEEVRKQMDSTHEYVKKLHDTQAKAEKNKERHGKGTPSDKLSNKQHSTNK